MERQSNFELLRIIAMFLVLAVHANYFALDGGPKNPQGKLVRVIEGEVFDVAVDLRKGSPTFGKWEGVTLSAENKKQFYIPEGFAHGFVVLSETATFVYKCTRLYDPKDEGGLMWNDPEIGIKWPVGNGFEPLLSEKDTKNPALKDLGFAFEL